MQGHYEFTGITETGLASFERPANPAFLFVGANATGDDSGSSPSNTKSVAQLLTLDGTPSNLNNLTVVLVNDASINFGATTLTLGTATTIEGFGNGITQITVPNTGVQPNNVIGDSFKLGGATYTNTGGAATLTANANVNVLTLGNGDTVQNININGGNNQIIGSGTFAFTLNGVVQTNANASAINLTNATGNIAMTGGRISGATGDSFVINGGNAAVSYSGSITNTAAHSVVVEALTGGSVTLSGTVNDSGTGILVQNNTGGTTTFSGTGNKLNTGANQAVTVTNNTGSTINFTGGSLAITTTSGTGFNATGGGTISVQGGGNTISTSAGTALNLNGITVGSGGFALQSVSATGGTNGIALNAITGTLNLGNVSVTNATTGLALTGSSATVTAGTVTINGTTTGLQFGANTGGSFTATGATDLTNISTTGINANGATGTYTFGSLSIGLTGTVASSRGIDFRSSDVQFQTGNLSITGNGTTTSNIIGIDLSGSHYPGGQPVGQPPGTANAPNILFATAAGQTAVIGGVNTGVLLGDGAVGSAGAYLRYGTQTAGNSGSSIAVISGGVTIDTSNLTSTTGFTQGRYEFTGVAYTGLSTFERTSNPNFVFVSETATGNGTGSNPSNTISVAQLLALDSTPANLNNKTVVFVNANGNINFAGTTLTLGTGTIVDGFGNGATVVVPNAAQPPNVIGDTFALGGGSFTDPTRGAATLTANAAINVLTLGSGDTVQNIDINQGNNQIIGSGTAGFTLNGVVQTNAQGSAISLTNSTGTINMAGVVSGSINGALGNSFVIDGGNSVVSYNGSITNTAGHSVVVQNRTGGSVTLSGTITDPGTGILVQNNTGGTTTFSGAGDTLNTGASQAVTLTNNTGSTINFTGGNLTITTTSATGFGASGGGTVSVTGTGNTITSGTGTALSLDSVTIGSGGFVLQSVSANGAVNGIALNNLTSGATVGVQVTGTGSTAASGGTIRNTTGAAVSLTNLGSLAVGGVGVTLNNMTITGGGGIVGTTFGTLSVANDSVSATGAAALSLTTGTIAAGSTFSTVSSSGSGTNGINLDTVAGGVNLGTVSVTNAASTGLAFINSSAAVAAGTLTINGATTGLQFGANTGGAFDVAGATNLTNITTTGIDANGATGIYTLGGATTISLTGASNARGIDLRSSDAQFQTGTLSINGNGTATSTNIIGIDLSGSHYPGGQPVGQPPGTANAPNIQLATGAGQTAAISGVNTGVKLGDGTVGSAGAYLRYGTQTAGNSGSSIAVLSGGVTIDTTNLTSTTGFMQGRYEFTGVTYTGKATFEQSTNPNFIFVSETATGDGSGSNPSNTMSVAQLLTLDGTPANLNNKTVVFVNANGNINFAATTLTLGNGTTIDGFGNSATVVVPGAPQPANVIGDTFVLGGGSFTDPRGAATLTANAGVNVLTLGNVDTVQNIDISQGNNQIIGSGTAGFTLSGVVLTNAG
ncbi:MAG: S-layer family protein, partial [Verrucomicrobia bacterium]|nr:S-layer family protein [Verrucomicrobiota bacterium]